MNVVSVMRFLLITLCSALLAGCALHSKPESQTQNVNEYKLYFVNPKWNDTMVVRILHDSLQNTTGYLLGGDTFAVDGSSRIDLAYQYIRNKSLLAFAEKFCDTANENPVHPTPLSYEDLDVFICDGLPEDHERAYYMIDSGNIAVRVWIEEKNLDRDPKPELILEIDRSHVFQHHYRIYQLYNLSELKFAGSIETTNKGCTHTPLEIFPKRYYFAARNFESGTSYSAEKISLFTLKGGLIHNLSSALTVKNSATKFSFTNDITAASTEITAELDFINERELYMYYSYTLSIHGYSCENPIIETATYAVKYSINNQIITPNDAEKRNNQIFLANELDLTPLFIDQIDIVKRKGTQKQKLALRDFNKTKLEEEYYSALSNK